ncbi:hypothetical protein CISIN_1g043418mg [Citrus sinensis]|uniref:Uncharacterized protein n=1 Tax=Citrus sinensis TaxID=2711 RepID=A0A067F761_CITSI|nr:hypothetical protein CISIN_1g043418mg [Citrus sinensis]
MLLTHRRHLTFTVLHLHHHRHPTPNCSIRLLHHLLGAITITLHPLLLQRLRGPPVPHLLITMIPTGQRRLGTALLILPLPRTSMHAAGNTYIYSKLNKIFFFLFPLCDGSCMVWYH